MTIRPALAAILAAATLSVAGRAGADPACPPSTSLDGPADLIAEVGSLLYERALPVGDDSPCGVLAIELRRASEGIVVIRDPGSDHPEARVVSDVAAAATVIESWARIDLARPLLAVREVKAPAPAPLAAPRPEVARTLPAPAVPANVLALTAAAELGVGADGSTWSGVALSGCAHLSAMCVGVLARLARDNRTGGDAERLDGTRIGLDILLTVETTWSRGAWRLRPGVGIGQGVVFSKIINNGVPDDEEGAAVLLRGRVGVGYELDERWSLELDPAVIYGLGADKIVRDFEEDGSVVPYPGDPGLHVRLGLGIRVETL